MFISRGIGAFALFLFCSGGAMYPCSADAAQSRGFDMADFASAAITVTEAVGRSGIVYSPNGEQFVTVVKQGDAGSDLVTYRLLLFRIEDIRAWLDGGRSGHPMPVELARFDASPLRTVDGQSYQDWEVGMRDVRWMDDRQLAFIAKNGEDFPQVYLLDVDSGRKVSLTPKPPGYITSFDLSLQANHLALTAFVPPGEAEWEAFLRGHTIGEGKFGWLTPLYFSGYQASSVAKRNTQCFLVNLSTGESRPVVPEASPDARAPFWMQLRFDPTGRRAILGMAVPVPAHWLEYPQVLEAPYLQRPATRLNPRLQVLEYENPVFGAMTINQLHIVDVATGAVRPLLDAPAGVLGAKVAWSADSRKVIVSRSAVPLRGATDEERARLAKAQAAIEVDVDTGEYAVVADYGSGPVGEITRTRRGTVESVEWRADGGVRILWRRHDDDLNRTERVFVDYRKKGRRWVAGTPVSAGLGLRSDGDGAGGIRVWVDQAPDVPPLFRARDLRTNKDAVIYDQNAHLRGVRMAKRETVRWTGPGGKELAGTLFLPAEIQPGKRHPLILQGATLVEMDTMYSPSGVGLSNAAPYSAQAFATHGFVVLTLPDLGSVPAGLSVTDYFTRIVEQAIDQLETRGLIDPGRVGLIGFSGFGNYVHHAVTFSQRPIAAAVVCDSMALTPWTYAATYGGFPGMSNASSHWGDRPSATIGKAFWGEAGIRRWAERSYFFNLDRIKSAILYQYHGPTYPANWESYAILKAHRRPVEMIRHVRETHSLVSPNIAFVSRTKVLDWMNFWLNAKEDPQSEKEELYARWRQMRDDWADQQRMEGNSGTLGKESEGRGDRP